MTVFEAAGLGLPSVSISNMVNWPDDVAVMNVRSNVPLSLDSVTPAVLAKAIQEQRHATYSPATEVSSGIVGAADRILAALDHVTRDRTPDVLSQPCVSRS